jgi:hypothetical protein
MASQRRERALIAVADFRSFSYHLSLAYMATSKREICTEAGRGWECIDLAHPYYVVDLVQDVGSDIIRRALFILVIYSCRIRSWML